MITIRNLKVSYTREVIVINDLNLAIEDGQVHGIVGLNGSGKTTLLNAIFGLKSIDSGEIRFNGERISKRFISFLPTESFFYSNITGREYLNLFKNPAFDPDEWNDLFSLPLDGIIDDYSTGMKKKLALLGVLKLDKPVMILDEPFNGLDMETCRIVRTLLLRMKGKGKTILVTSHIIETLTNLCDCIHYLNQGIIKASRSRHEFSGFEKEIFDAIETKHEKNISRILGEQQ